jgi:hypothetical protein
MIALWVALAFASPPSGLDLDDIDTWAARSDDLMVGPPGCWEFEGDAVQRVAWYLPASFWSRGETKEVRKEATFKGRLEDQRWVQFEVEGEDQQDGDNAIVIGGGEEVDLDIPIEPIVGKRGSSGGTGTADKAVSMVDNLLDSIEPSTSTAFVQWEETPPAVRFVQHVPLDDSRRPPELELSTWFPMGGPATKIDGTFPKRFKIGEFPLRITVMRGQFHVRGQRVGDVVLPGVESLSMVVGVLGYTFGYEQKVVYRTARPCTPEAPG